LTLIWTSVSFTSNAWIFSSTILSRLSWDCTMLARRCSIRWVASRSCSAMVFGLAAASAAFLAAIASLAAAIFSWP
jgi:hypothetical protein